MKPIELAQARQPSASTNLSAGAENESSTSEHSFVLQDIVIDRSCSSTSTDVSAPQLAEPAGMPAARLPPIGVFEPPPLASPRAVKLSEIVVCGPPVDDPLPFTLAAPAPHIHPSPFGRAQPPAPPGRASLAPAASRVPSLGAQPLAPTPEDSQSLNQAPHIPLEEGGRRRSLGLGRARSVPLKVSIELPRDHPEDGLDELMAGDVQGRLVRRRRRLPLQYIIFFGMVGCYAAVVTTMGMSLSAFNFSKIKVNRAKDATDQLREDLMPILNAIRDELNKLNG